MAGRIPLVPVAPPPPASASPDVVERVRRFGAARARSAREACEFCGAGIADQHGHLVDVSRRTLLCACRPCYLLFTQDGAGGGRFRAVPTRFAVVGGDAALEAWEQLDLPIGLAFFFRNSVTGRTTAFFPSPAGATESELPLPAWDALIEAAPVLSTLVADVEAVLVRRTGGGITALIVPIDACYELVGVLRVCWRGLQGGDELWSRVDEFFAQALERARAGAA